MWAMSTGVEASSNLKEEWRFWEQKFDLFITASGASEKQEATSIATCLHAPGDAALKVYNAFELSVDDKKIDVIKTKFREYCTPRNNELKAIYRGIPLRIGIYIYIYIYIWITNLFSRLDLNMRLKAEDLDPIEAMVLINVVFVN